MAKVTVSVGATTTTETLTVLPAVKVTVGLLSETDRVTGGAMYWLLPPHADKAMAKQAHAMHVHSRKSAGFDLRVSWVPPLRNRRRPQAYKMKGCAGS